VAPICGVDAAGTADEGGAEVDRFRFDLLNGQS